MVDNALTYHQTHISVEVKLTDDTRKGCTTSRKTYHGATDNRELFRKTAHNRQGY